MKQILFVDDEQQVLDGLRSALRKQRKQWNMVFACSGEAGLAELFGTPFDVVVSDMRMPGMDGAAFLQRVKDQHPSVVRIVLSGHAEPEAIQRAIPVSHQFVSKPCDAETITRIIMRACELQVLLKDEELRRVIGKVDRLPALPRIYAELSRAFADPEVSARQIARIVEQDPSLCAVMLKLVNSSYFGLSHRIGAVDTAVAYLGVEVVRGLALTAQVFSAVKSPLGSGLSFEAMQTHCLVAAKIARRMTDDPKLQEDVFAAALLHDVGKVLLALTVPDRLQLAVEAAAASGKTFEDVEEEVVGVTHAAAGAYLLGLWGLPMAIIEAVAHHHRPMACARESIDAVALVHIADALASKTPEAIEPALLEQLGLADAMPGWIEIAAEESRRFDGAGSYEGG